MTKTKKLGEKFKSLAEAAGSLDSSIMATTGLLDSENLDHTLTTEELKARADKMAKRILNVPSRHEAFKMLDEGQLQGTIAEVEFSMLRDLILADKMKIADDLLAEKLQAEQLKDEELLAYSVEDE